ncbi:hypothetical protein [Candidatus Enterovibrio escicola]|uniref:Uncharacterized protein n=1 Tax=Candidatus Enterovibrio escicola TaxID=1927127 RepID=A0A2A5T2S1_9GAMM|nr:hypothetical protein [Candidatus Enterovibrio escacola]PCS22452.1 hypothetical protein BTN49_1978 [Candidatus Enterovibrio escacola]
MVFDTFMKGLTLKQLIDQAMLQSRMFLADMAAAVVGTPKIYISRNYQKI